MNTAQMLASIADYAPGLVTVYNIQTGEFLYVNNSITRILGYQPEDFINGGVNFVNSLIHPDDMQEILSQNQIVQLDASNLNEGLSDQPVMSFEFRIKDKSGNWQWLRTEGNAFTRDKNGQVETVLNISLNISDHKLKEKQLTDLTQDFETKFIKQTQDLRQSENMYRNLIQVIEDYAIFHLDPNGQVTSWNEGIGKILGYSESEVIGLPISVFFTAVDQKNDIHMKELEDARTLGTVINDGIRVRKDGTTFYAVTTLTPIWNESGELEGFSKTMRDITELKEAQETIRYHALHDILTGLGNRKALDENFHLSKSLAIRNGNKIGMIFLDLDRFKTINDTLGHGIGDLVLKEMAQRLKAAVRDIDVVARLGGDEFVILINEVNSPQSMHKVATKISNAIAPVARIEDHSLHVTASMGIAMFPNDGQDIYTLLKNADTAMYRAKDAGRNRFKFYDYSMNLQSGSRLSLEQDLRTAVINGELHMDYQPFIDVKTGKVGGVESLLRWQHPKLGNILPSDFIPLAEETGMIVSIGKWILNTVCTEAKQFIYQDKPLKVTINLSGRQFAETELVNTVSKVLKETKFEPDYLEFEITESVAMENIVRSTTKLAELKALGVDIAIDDFGTGYSSLSYLKRFPVGKLKIDRSFIKHAMTDTQDSAIIQAIISMGQTLGLTVCAEGVEDEQQLQLLRAMGCDLAQGYLISKPLPAPMLEEWLAKQ